MRIIGPTAVVAVVSCLLASSVSAQSNQQLRLTLAKGFAGIGYVVPTGVTPDGRQLAEAELIMNGSASSVEKRDALGRMFLPRQ
jgi:hypothetical protein